MEGTLNRNLSSFWIVGFRAGDLQMELLLFHVPLPTSITKGGGQKDQTNSIPELVFFKTLAIGYKKLKCIKL
jgi:hypothetical protein